MDNNITIFFPYNKRTSRSVFLPHAAMRVTMFVLWPPPREKRMMADTSTQHTMHTSANGHLSPGVTWTKVLEVVVASEDDNMFTLGLIEAVKEAGNGCLFHNAIQQRCARIRL